MSKTSEPLLTLEPLLEAVREGVSNADWELSGLQKRPVISSRASGMGKTHGVLISSSTTTGCRTSICSTKMTMEALRRFWRLPSVSWRPYSDAVRREVACDLLDKRSSRPTLGGC
jgi:hypothetical protein